MGILVTACVTAVQVSWSAARVTEVYYKMVASVVCQANISVLRHHSCMLSQLHVQLQPLC
jgi:hypothetical protein